MIGGEPFVKVRQETGGIPVRPSLAAPAGLIESIPEVADDRIGLGKSIDGNTPLPYIYIYVGSFILWLTCVSIEFQEVLLVDFFLCHWLIIGNY